MNNHDIINLKNDMESELRNNILKFWIEHSIDNENGGFYGFISNNLTVNATHDKASVLNFRILWTFSTAYRYFKDEKYLLVADRAYNYIIKNFIDQEYSGVYWMLDYKGNVTDSKKQTYSIAFAIYGLSEYFRVTGRKESLEYAIQLYNSIETHIYDYKNKGYIEAASRDYSSLADMSLSAKDLNAAKSMNTHLHVMEAYTNLFRVWKDTSLEKKLEELINVTIDHIIDPQTFQFKLFFDESWKSLAETISYGHDIEGSWLLYEAAEVLGNKELLTKARNISINMAKKVYSAGIDRKNGGLFYEEEYGLVEDNKDWWPQAEAVVGFTNAYQLTGGVPVTLMQLLACGISSATISLTELRGEWFWGTSADGSKVTKNEKAGPWKCPYHNSRMCYEMIERLEKL